MSRSTRTSAFTLVEVVVSSAVAVAIALAVAGVLAAAFGAFGRVASGGRAEAAIERLDFFEALRADLACAVPEPRSLEGDSLSLRLVRLAAPPLGAGPAGARAETVRWEPASGAARRVAERTGASAAETVHPFAPRFSYARYVPPPATNAPASLEWRDDWRRPELPAAVRVASAAGTSHKPHQAYQAH